MKKQEKKKFQKGEYGYIDYRKKTQLTHTMMIFGIAVLIFTAGYFLNKRSTSNIFTILSVLCVLPAARSLVAYLVMMRYRTPEQKRYTEIKDITGKEDLLSDLVFTSSQKVMNLDFLVMKNKTVLGLATNPKAAIKEAQDYLEKHFQAQGIITKVKLFTEYEKFKTVVSLHSEKEKKQEKKETEAAVSELEIHFSQEIKKAFLYLVV